MLACKQLMLVVAVTRTLLLNDVQLSPCPSRWKCANTPGDTTNSELTYKCLSMLVIGPQSRCLWLHWGGGRVTL